MNEVVHNNRTTTCADVKKPFMCNEEKNWTHLRIQFNKKGVGWLQFKVLGGGGRGRVKGGGPDAIEARDILETRGIKCT